MIDSTFKKINRLFVLSFENDDNDPARNSFFDYHMSSVEIIDFDKLIVNKSFSINPKSKQRAYKKLVEISRNNSYTTRNLLD